MANGIDPDLVAASGRVPHSGFGIILRINQEFGIVEVLCMRSVETDPRTKAEKSKLQLPGGSGLRGESPQTTTDREVCAEVAREGLVIPFDSHTLVHRVMKRGDTDKGGGVHTQHFFHLSIAPAFLSEHKSDAEMYRRATKTEPDGAILGSPEFMDILEFIEYRETKKTHREAAINMLHYLAETAPIAPALREKITECYREGLEQHSRFWFSNR